ncbi:MAG: Re/Si-specific NAD(P)(+) transhydrogenase subunit alpha [Bacteroidia bacterium]|nr:Re/Si-specific NAD(P)(+) transhydrogenase subunit alpha [Bacteroidia bacterium]MBT8268129.1 Re/Si-specific NAD(P)(+) transhydrogenase subunit alpha [Bacteroidia bacterium]NNF81486.1 Re/Si-specific NAD(P)(+) transhydrogenase subunit alpha [Flavobacteriaceae bacterium]NNK71484.1 Re/Si-specific NAD(P)(+) transhydrogenase subunit alpha [Flavobacteriaceae bacterium]NNL81658.1 Re/Si-specific NAD(P)(+) transhydrogenase subunit alpha [Flavobacteriaceae bacterium]
MTIGILKETQKGETRVAISPNIAKQLVENNFKVLIEKDAGEKSSFKNSDYRAVGAATEERGVVFKESDVLLRVNPFTETDLKLVNSGQVLISQMFHKSDPEMMEALAEANVSSFSLDAMPRISRAQDMDVLSSQSNLAGYKAVIRGAYEMKKILPLMMTAAGTITPARVLVYGVGVAGLQAIATAKRLGAVVEATDIRPETKEQTESLGAKFIEVKDDEEEAGSVYAKVASEDYARRQKEAVDESLFKADLVITTAMVPGRKSPVLITEEQVKKMKNGSVIIDLAAAQGGNCELSKMHKEVVANGVKIIGTTIAPESVSTNASELFAKNMFNFIMHLTDDNEFNWDLEDEITDETLIVHKGLIRQNGKTQPV